MTKRFTYIKNNSISQYSSLPIQEIGGKVYHCQGIVDKLNKLSDENEQLKQEIQSINKDLTQIMLILLDNDIVSKLTVTELKAFERLSKFKGDVK